MIQFFSNFEVEDRPPYFAFHLFIIFFSIFLSLGILVRGDACLSKNFEPCDPSLSPSDLRKPSPRPFSRRPTFGHLARRLFHAVRPSDAPSCDLPTFSDLRTLRPATFRRFPTLGRSFAVSLTPLRAAARYTLFIYIRARGISGYSS